MVCGALRRIPFFEYSATEVKRAVTGSGSADKDQVAKVLSMLLGAQEFGTADASDALALAVCHAQQFQGVRSSSAVVNQLLKAKPRQKKRLSMAESLGLSPERVGNSRRVDFSKKS